MMLKWRKEIIPCVLLAACLMACVLAPTVEDRNLSGLSMEQRRKIVKRMEHQVPFEVKPRAPRVVRLEP